jgi:hypothetical protein
MRHQIPPCIRNNEFEFRKLDAPHRVVRFGCTPGVSVAHRTEQVMACWIRMTLYNSEAPFHSCAVGPGDDDQRTVAVISDLGQPRSGEFRNSARFQV